MYIPYDISYIQPLSSEISYNYKNSKNEIFGLRGYEFKHVKDLITFIYGDKSTKGVKLTTKSISNLINRKLNWKPVPPTLEN